MRRWDWLTEKQHRQEISDAISELDPRRVDELLLDGDDRLADAIDHYEEIGPDHDDCDPMLLIAEATCQRRRGNVGHAEYANRMAAWCRTQLLCRVARDISEARG